MPMLFCAAGTVGHGLLGPRALAGKPYSQRRTRAQ
jgi:hypothetical protein